MNTAFENLKESLKTDSFVRFYGEVRRVSRDSLRIHMPGARVGSLCHVQSQLGPVAVEVVALNPEGHIAMPLDDLTGVQLGDKVVLAEETGHIPVGDALLGSVVDSTMRSYETGVVLPLAERVPLYGLPLNPMAREPISKPLDLGVRAINACLTCGIGQRLGIFAGSGVGKSVLLGMLARHTSADVVVLALIGERGRELKDFLERELDADARKKMVVVAETADTSSVRRVRGAYVATAVAEYFRRKGLRVLLLMDSLTRFAMAQREIGGSAGEAPTSKGYPASVFSSLAKLVERAGNWGDQGSITGLFTVLVEGDDLEDPVADAARAILDGHIVLSRRLANRGHYPAIDLLSSISRVMDPVVSVEHRKAARKLKELLARYQENEDAIQYQMYNRGSDPEMDHCIEMYPRITEFLKQDREDRAIFANTRDGLLELMG
ncbi:FliI/YscN family ATPase [bacterium]|nr:FliI/YscN family ATPase [bacterium]